MTQNTELINTLSIQIKEIESQVHMIINSEVDLKQKYAQITSIPGVGKVLAEYFSEDKCFQKYLKTKTISLPLGSAPFENRSGASIFGKSRVFLYADKTLKTLLHMASISAIKSKNDIQRYYQRKVKEGKK